MEALKSCLRTVERVLCINTYQQPLALYRGVKPVLDPFIIGQHFNFSSLILSSLVGLYRIFYLYSIWTE